jgi:hypothetical protein
MLLPKYFWLGWEMHGFQVQSHVRWGDDNKFGVRFIGPKMPC